MKARVLVGLLLLLAASTGGVLLYRETFIPVPLVAGRDLFVPAQPAFGEDAAVIEAVLPAGAALEAFLEAQSDLALLARAEDGRWAGQLLAGLQRSRHGRRWRLTVAPGWRMQDGTLLDADRLLTSLGSAWAREGCAVRILDPATVELRFAAAPADLPARLATWRVPGSGPFLRRGSTLVRFDGFTLGRAGFAEVQVLSDPAFLSSRAWADGVASGRWAWAAFPGSVAPEDMARVRRAPCDELRLKDGSVWFLSRRMRRLRPDPQDWTRTRLFGAWKGAMDLPYEP